MNYDVAVIGAGVTGLSIAWHLTADQHRSVVLFDGQGVGSGASAIQPGGVRQQWGTRMSCRLAIESFRFYEAFDRRVRAERLARPDQVRIPVRRGDPKPAASSSKQRRAPELRRHHVSAGGRR